MPHLVILLALLAAMAAPAPAPDDSSSPLPADDNTPATQPAAFSPPAGVPVLHPTILTLDPHDSDWSLTPLPVGHLALTTGELPTLDLAVMLAATWRWWLGGLFGLAWLWTAWRLRKLRRFARLRLPPGAEYYKRCHYCLTGTSSPACPECGHPLTQSNRAVARPLRWRYARLAFYLTLLPVAFLSLHLTEQRWLPKEPGKLCWHSRALMSIAEWTRLDPWCTDWTAYDPALVAYDFQTGQRIGIVVWKPAWFSPNFFSSSSESVAHSNPYIVISPDGSKALWRVDTEVSGFLHPVLIDLPTGREISLGERTRSLITGQDETYFFSSDSQSLFTVNTFKAGTPIQRVALQTDEVIDLATSASLDNSPPSNSYVFAARQLSPDRLLFVTSGADEGHISMTAHSVLTDPLSYKELRRSNPLTEFFNFQLTADHIFAVVKSPGPATAPAATEPAAKHDLTFTVYDLHSNKITAAWPIDNSDFIDVFLFEPKFVVRGDQTVLMYYPHNDQTGSFPRWIEARDAATGRLTAVLQLPTGVEAAEMLLTGDQSRLLVHAAAVFTSLTNSTWYVFDLTSLPTTNPPTPP